MRTITKRLDTNVHIIHSTSYEPRFKFRSFLIDRQLLLFCRSAGQMQPETIKHIWRSLHFRSSSPDTQLNNNPNIRRTTWKDLRGGRAVPQTNATVIKWGIVYFIRQGYVEVRHRYGQLFNSNNFFNWLIYQIINALNSRCNYAIVLL